MAFTYDLDTNRGKVRFEIGDTNESHAVYTDDEIDYALTQGSTVAGAVRLLLLHQKTVHAWRGDSGRVAAVDETIEARNELPTVTVIMPAALPMDDGWDSNS